MLDPKRDRLSYTQDLFRPPAGFRFERAIATTYSLDLRALIAAALPLGLGEEPDVSALRNPLLVWRALHAVSGKIAVFHEDGQIAVPRGKFNRLLSLLEQSLVPVRLNDDNALGYPAFHAKTWTLVFRNDMGECAVRFAALSRNLTFDRSWDVAVSMDGIPRRRRGKTAGLLDGFFTFLERHIPDDSAHGGEIHRIVRFVAESVRKCPPVLGPDAEPWTDCEILPLLGGGVSVADKSHPLHDDPLLGAAPSLDIAPPVREAVVMSPFLGAGVVRRMSGRIVDSGCGECAILSRRDSFAAVPPDTLHGFRAYSLKESVVQGEATPLPGTGADDAPSLPGSDIHAKLFFWRRGSESSLLLGSANATDSAFSRNVELLVRLHADRTKFSAKNLLDDLFLRGRKDEENPFEEIAPDDCPEFDAEAEGARRYAERTIKRFCRNNPRAHAKRTSGGMYSIDVNLPDGVRFPSDLDLVPCLVPEAPKTAIPHGIRFDGIPLCNLSTLYRVTVQSGGETISRIVQIPTDGIPEEERNAAVCDGFVEENGGIEAFLSVLFSDRPGLDARRLRTGRASLPATVAPSNGTMSLEPGLYEKMLRATTRSDDFATTLAEADRLLQRNVQAKRKGDDCRDRKMLLALIETFRAAMPKKGGVR